MLMFMQMLETADERSRFELLFHTYRNVMFHVANRILDNEHDAEDAVQQAFFAILKHMYKISEIECPQTRSFVVTIVERKAIDIYRAKRRNAVLPFEEAYVTLSHKSEAEEALHRTDLAKAMAMLPAKYRELLFLKYDNGYSEEEIAAICSMTRANVKKTIQRAKKKLELILEGQEA